MHSTLLRLCAPSPCVIAISELDKSCEDSVYVAEVAEQTERYEGMCRCCEQWVILPGLLLLFRVGHGYA